MTCPHCASASNYSTLELVQSKKSIYFKCTQCNSFYPIQQVPYISNICSQKNCKQECISACFPGAIFILKNRLTAINYEKCQFCNQCVISCPLKAIVCFWTPFFKLSTEAPTIIAENATTTISNEGISFKDFNLPHFIRFRPDLLLNSLNTKLWMSVVVDCYEFIKDHILESSSIIFDNGCLNNSFKTLLEGHSNPTLNVLSADVKLYSESYLGRYFSPVEFLHDGRTLPLVSGKIDVVTSNYVLEHVSDPHKYLKEIHRVLKWEGLLFISVPTPRWFIAYFLRNFWYLYPKHLKNDFKQAIRHPVRDFLTYNAHEKDWNKEKEGKITFIDEIKRWKIKNWDDLYLNNGFQIIEKNLFGNAFSLAGKKFFLNRPFFNFIFSGIISLYILSKR